MTAPGGVTANFSAVVVPSFTIASSTGAQTVQPGGTAVYTIVVTAQNGAISNPVTLAASGLPPGATAAFSHTAVTPGSSSATSQLSIQTASTTAVVAGRGSGWPLAASALPLFGLLFATGKRRRRWITLAVFLFASLGALTVLSGCGGGFAGSSGAPATSYTITVTGTSGAEQQTTAVQLTVQ